MFLCEPYQLSCCYRLPLQDILDCQRTNCRMDLLLRRRSLPLGQQINHQNQHHFIHFHQIFHQRRNQQFTNPHLQMLLLPIFCFSFVWLFL